MLKSAIYQKYLFSLVPKISAGRRFLANLPGPMRSYSAKESLFGSAVSFGTHGKQTSCYFIIRIYRYFDSPITLRAMILNLIIIPYPFRISLRLVPQLWGTTCLTYILNSIFVEWNEDANIHKIEALNRYNRRTLTLVECQNWIYKIIIYKFWQN